MLKYVIVLCFVVALAQCKPAPQEIAVPQPELPPETQSETQQELGPDAQPETPPQTPPETPEINTTAAPDQSSTTESGGNSIIDDIKNSFEKKKATLGQMIDRLGDAAKQTIVEQKKSIKQAITSIGSAAKQNVKAKLDTLHSASNVLLFVPKFAVNALNTKKCPDVNPTSTQKPQS